MRKAQSETKLKWLEHAEKVLWAKVESFGTWPCPENVVLKKLLFSVQEHITKTYIEVYGPQCFNLE